MSDSTSQRIKVCCPSCGKQLNLPGGAIGRKARCVACEDVFVVAAAAADPPIRQAEPAEEPDTSETNLFGDLAQAEEDAQVIRLSPEEPAGPPVPVSARMPEPPRLGKKLNYDRLVAEADPGLWGRTRGAIGPLAKGCFFSFSGAVIGALIWLGIGVASGYEFGIVAWLVGILAGVGMQAGTRSQSSAAGGIAACFALFGILLGKVLIVVYVLWPIISAAYADTRDLDYQRGAVVEYMAQEVIDKQEDVGEMMTAEQEEKTWADARKKVEAMPEGEVRRLFEEYENQAEAGAAAMTAADSGATQEQAPSLATTFFQVVLGFKGLIFCLLAVVSAYKIGCGGFGR